MLEKRLLDSGVTLGITAYCMDEALLQINVSNRVSDASLGH